MRLFRSLYDKMLQWAEHRHAPIYLAFLSFIEASFFPLPPDLMLAPMTITQPKRAWRYATLTTISSVLGGIFGYVLGMFFISLIDPVLIDLGYQATFLKVQHWFLLWGFYVLFFCGLTPIPYKVFTVASGAVGLPLLSFVLASVVGRSIRFFLVSGLIRLGGPKMKDYMRNYIDWVGWICLAIIMAIILIKFNPWS